MKNLILSLIILISVTSRANASDKVESGDLKKIVTHSVISDGDTLDNIVPARESEKSGTESVTIAPNAKTATVKPSGARPKIWDVQFFGRR